MFHIIQETTPTSMKHHLALAFFSILLLSCLKPTPITAAPPAADRASALKESYALCGQYGDLAAAAPLAYQLAIAEPAEAGKWKEDLATIYFTTGRHASCLKVLADLTANHGGQDELPILRMKALCHEALGQKPEATDAWKVVWEKGGSASAAVRLVGLLIERNEIGEADAIITGGLAAADAKTVTIMLPKTADELQKIPAAAALHNLKGLLLFKRDSAATEVARTEFEAALALAPDFELAKRNLAGLAEPAANEATEE